METARMTQPRTRLATLLKARGWDERVLASQTGLSESYLNRLKNGRIKSPSVRIASKIARAFGLAIEEIFLNSK